MTCHNLRCRLVDAVCDVGLGRRYGHTGDHSTDCVRLAYAALEMLHGDRVRVHKRALHLAGHPAGSMANIDALVASGIGDEVEWLDGDGESCYLVQGWVLSDEQMATSPGSRQSGHCFFWLGGEYGRILHSTTAGPDWYADEHWPQRRERYGSLRLVRLV